ncbi:hypothetical protein AMTRI_Chr07g28960 [Amborella trichopoda]
MEIEDSTGGQDEDVPEISLHVIAGTCAPETIRINGNLHHKAVIVLIDSGMGLKPFSSGRLVVIVASGERLSSTSKCSHI